MARCLNEEQRKLAEENHNLIYGYCKRHNVDTDEYYDILAIGLCKAATVYDSSTNNKFSTLAERCMRNELNDYFRSVNKKNNIPENNIISYDAPSEDGNGVDLKNIVHNNVSLDEKLISKQTINEMLSLLNEKEKTVTLFLIQGNTEREIAVMMNFTPQNVNKIKKGIRKKLQAYL